MIKKIINLSLLLALGIGMYFINLQYPNVYLERLAESFFSLAVLYVIFKLILDFTLSKYIKDGKTRYSLRKVLSLLFVVFVLFILLGIWTIDITSLSVAYGLIAAGVAISLQDFFKNFIGGISIFLKRLYQIGDRIEINNVHGDVMDIGILYTTILEIKEWVGGDQATGRILNVPNGNALHQVVKNYTKDHSFIWDEIVIPITYDSDWHQAVELLEEEVKKETAAITEKAEEQIKHLAQKYFLSKRNVEPRVFVRATDSWIELHVRYITDVRERRLFHTHLLKILLDAIQSDKNIKIASETLSIIDFPGTK